MHCLAVKGTPLKRCFSTSIVSNIFCVRTVVAFIDDDSGTVMKSIFILKLHWNEGNTLPSLNQFETISIGKTNVVWGEIKK